MKIFIATLLTAILAFTSCEIESDVHGYSYKYPGDKLALIGYISPQNGVEASVTRSTSPADGYGDPLLADVTLFLCEDGEEVAECHTIDDIHYTLDAKDYHIDTNRKYSLKAVSKSLGTAYSKPSSFPSPLQLDSVVYEKNDDWYHILTFYFFNDSPQDYCRFHMTKYGHGLAYDNNVIGGFSELPKAYSHYEINTHDDIHHRDSAFVEMRKYADEMYIYEKSLRDNFKSETDPYFDNVFPVYDNITGGYGFVCTYISQSVMIMINEEKTYIPK